MASLARLNVKTSTKPARRFAIADIAAEHTMVPAMFDKRRVVVTGGAGFIGSQMVDALLAQGAHVTIVDNFSTGLREFVSKHPKATLAEIDLLDADACKRVFAGHDFVFHFAANADVRDGLAHPRKDVEQNPLA